MDMEFTISQMEIDMREFLKITLLSEFFIIH